jgi:hypothetical protein
MFSNFPICSPFGGNRIAQTLALIDGPPVCPWAALILADPVEIYRQTVDKLL